MPPKVSSEDRRLMAAYEEAALRINRTLADLNAGNRKMVLRRVDIIIGELEGMSARYIAEGLPQHFRKGSEEAIVNLKRLHGVGEIDETFGSVHTEAMQALADDAALKFANALEGVKRESRSFVSGRLKQQTLEELIASEIEGAANPSARLQEVFAEEGITAFRSGSRRWTLENYSAMLTHTILAEAHNTGAMTRYLSNGVEFAEVIERGDAPDVTCKTMRGKIVWLGDRRLLPPYHPNCMGGVKPFSGDTSQALRSIDDPRIPAEARKMMENKN